MNLELSKSDINLLLKSIGTRIRYIENESLPYLEKEEYIKQEQAEVTRLNILKVELQKKRARLV